MRVLLLGYGMQGRAVLHDLLHGDADTIVTVADANPALAAQIAEYPAERVTARRLDAADEPSVEALMRDADVVVEALPGPFALAMGRTAARVGVSLVSSMYYRDPQERDPARQADAERAIADLARLAGDQGITILTEFGLDPGLDLVLGVRALSELDEVHEFHAYGAGLPEGTARDNPLRYKFSWSPIGVMRSYNRPARVIRSGRPVDIDPTTLFEPHRYHLLKVDGLDLPMECYPNGDAVHYAELFGVSRRVREMARYTGRWPGHCAFWDVLVKLGFLDRDAVGGGSGVSPMDVTAAVLASQPQFQYADNEADLTFVRVDVRGLRAGQRRRVVYDLIDHRDFATGLTSMQRTVGFTLALGARLIAPGRSLAARGLLTPLQVPYDLVFPALANKGIHVTRRELEWG